MGSRFLLLVFAILMIFREINCNSRTLEGALDKEFSIYYDNGNVGKLLKNVIKVLNLGNEFRNWDNNNDHWDERKLNLFCKTCSIIVNHALKASDVDNFGNYSINLCVTLGLGTHSVCEGLVLSNKQQLQYILKHTTNPTGRDICGVIFFGRGCSSMNPDRNFVVQLPDTPKPPINTAPLSHNPPSTMKILHLADTHYDPYYFEGAPVECDEIYLCCRQNSKDSKNISELAGKWGSYGKCDIPIWTLEAIYKQISVEHKDIDLIIWTGDIISHNVWNISKEDSIRGTQEMADLVSEYFPGIPVFPSVGNHEAAPVNLFPQPYIHEPEFEISWLYDQLASIWQRWLPAEAARSIAYGAFYSTEIKPGLRIISVNTNYCYAFNWWLILDSTDVANELDLMAKELQKAEDDGDRVYIIGHISPGHKNCLPSWSHEFNKIVARYENTVSGLFFAHTHRDHFEVLFDPENKTRAYEVAYIAQSQTTYDTMNPGYKIYTTEGDFEGSYYRVLDHENWLLDLGVTNEQDTLFIMKSYTAKEEYGMDDLSAESFHKLALKMNEKNSEIFEKFYRNYVKSTPKLLEAGCRRDCKSNLICDLLTSDTSDISHCEEL